MNRTEQPITVEIKNSEDLNIDFQQYWFILKRQWLAATAVAGGFLALSVAGIMLMSKPNYIAEGKILVKPDESASLTGLLKEAKTQLTPLTLQGNPLKTEAEIILSQPVLNKVVNSVMSDEKGNQKISEATLKNNLKVEEIRGTDILQISYTNTDPAKAALVVNQIMKSYIENNRLVNRLEALAARNFIAKQLPATQETVGKAEQALRKFKEKNKLVDIDEEAKLSLETVEKLKTAISEAKAKFSDVNAQNKDLINKLGMDSQRAIIVAKLSQSSSVQATLASIQKTEDELKAGRTRLQDENPQIIDLNNQLITLRSQLQERIVQEIGGNQLIPESDLRAGELELGLMKQLINLQVEQNGLSNLISSLEDNLFKYQQRINSLPKLKEEEREIQRRLEAAQATYETLLKKLKEIEAAENQNIINARIVEAASQPMRPSLDKKLVSLLIGSSAISVVLFIATVLILEKRDFSLKSVKQIQNIFSYPLLAAIPAFEKKKAVHYQGLEKLHALIPVIDAPHSPISEVYRMLQANLEFIDSDQKPKVIVISSSIPQEGKSTVAANLATVFAELKKRVLLIDADMRHPSQHEIWEQTNELGLSNVIVGRCDTSMATKEIMPNLHLLTSGVIPPNPVTLLKSQAMATLINNESRNYDYIVFDAPPILMAADALILGKITDGILMVSRPGVIDSNSAINTKGLLEQSGQNVLGLVINGVILNNESDSYFHFRTNYHAPDSPINSRKIANAKTPENANNPKKPVGLS
ncbi:Fis family transcriptional regulator [Rivularia sp. IAM M-261]|nr:Fis family transcriptional regulator [Rivularia sp. IAM M-261]